MAKKRSFLLRLFLAYAMIPLLAPAFLTFLTRRNDGSRLGFDAYANGLPIFGTVTLISMLVLGLPALLLFNRFGVKSFRSFAMGGFLCAILTAAVASGPSQVSMILYYGLIGAVAGMAFRLILFGTKTGLPDR